MSDAKNVRKTYIGKECFLSVCGIKCCPFYDCRCLLSLYSDGMLVFFLTVMLLYFNVRVSFMCVESL